MALTDFDQAQPPNYAYTAYNPVAGITPPAPVLNSTPSTPYPIFSRARFPGLVMPAGGGGASGTTTGNTGYASILPANPSQPISLSTLFGQPTQNGSTPTTQLFPSQKSAAVQGQINTATADHGTNQAANEQSLADFVRELKASRPAVDAAGQQEQNAVSNVYDTGPGGLEAKLNTLNQQRTNAINSAAAMAMDRATRTNSLRRLQAPNSSYLDRLFAQDLSGVATSAAGASADQGRQDLQYLNDQRLGAVGRRQSIIDSILQRDLAPIQPTQQVEAAGLSSLGQISDLNNANNVFQSPEDAYTRRLNFLQSLGYNVPISYQPSSMPSYIPSSIYRPISY